MRTLWVIMLMRAHFLSRLLQSKAYTGGLIFLLGSRQSKEGWRVSARPVACSACAHKCVHLHVFIHPSLCLCVSVFFIRSDPSASRYWCHFPPCQSKATAECQSLRALVYRQLTCMSVLFGCTLFPCCSKFTKREGFLKVKVQFISCERLA